MKLPLRSAARSFADAVRMVFMVSFIALLFAGGATEIVMPSSPIPLAGGLTGCVKGQEAKDVKQGLDTALDVVQLGCLMQGLGAFEIDPALAAKICNVAPKLVPVVSDLIGYREAGRKAGVTWKSGSGLDGGAAPDAGAGR